MNGFHCGAYSTAYSSPGFEPPLCCPFTLCENRSVRNYAVVIHEDPQGGFWAEVPALPGCYSQGETIDELKQNIREAIAGVLEVLKEEGRGPDSTVQILDVAV